MARPEEAPSSLRLWRCTISVLLTPVCSRQSENLARNETSLGTPFVVLGRVQSATGCLVYSGPRVTTTTSAYIFSMATFVGNGSHQNQIPRHVRLCSLLLNPRERKFHNVMPSSPVRTLDRSGPFYAPPWRPSSMHWRTWQRKGTSLPHDRSMSLAAKPPGFPCHFSFLEVRTALLEISSKGCFLGRTLEPG